MQASASLGRSGNQGPGQDLLGLVDKYAAELDMEKDYKEVYECKVKEDLSKPFKDGWMSRMVGCVQGPGKRG